MRRHRRRTPPDGGAVAVPGGGLTSLLPVTAPGVLRALVGAAVYLALLAVIGTGIGWMLRR